MRFLGEMRSKLRHLACFHGGPHLHKWLDKWWINKVFSGFSSVCEVKTAPITCLTLSVWETARGAVVQGRPVMLNSWFLMVWEQHQPISIMYFKSCSDFIKMHSSDFNKMACSVLWATIQHQLRAHFLFTASANLLLQAWGCRRGEQDKELSWCTDKEKSDWCYHQVCLSMKDYAMINIPAWDIHKPVCFVFVSY